MPAKKTDTKKVGALEVTKDAPTKVVNGIEYISVDENTRMYEFPNGRQLQIDNVRLINVSESRGHRLITADGTLFYIKPVESWFIIIKKYEFDNQAFTF